MAASTLPSAFAALYLALHSAMNVDLASAPCVKKEVVPRNKASANKGVRIEVAIVLYLVRIVPRGQPTTFQSCLKGGNHITNCSSAPVQRPKKPGLSISFRFCICGRFGTE